MANEVHHFAICRTFGDQVADEEEAVARPDTYFFKQGAKLEITAMNIANYDSSIHDASLALDCYNSITRP